MKHRVEFIEKALSNRTDRERKRRTDQRQTEMTPHGIPAQDVAAISTKITDAKVVKRGRGRPRKILSVQPVKRGRGRPRNIVSVRPVERG